MTPNNPLACENFRNALACPLNCEELSLGANCSDVVYELWFGVMHRHMPESWIADSLLESEPWPRSQRAPDDDTIADQCRDDFELTQAAQHVARSRKDVSASWSDLDASVKNPHLGMDFEPNPTSPAGVWIDLEFLRLTQWIKTFRAVPRSERAKHWPVATPSMPKESFIAESVRKGNEGLILPNISATDLREAALDGVAYLVHSILRERNESNFQRDRVDDLLHAWNDVTQTQAYRFAARYEAPIGAYEGRDARFMIFDFDPLASQVHCYPAADDPSDSVRWMINDEGIGPLDARAGKYLRMF